MLKDEITQSLPKILEELILAYYDERELNFYSFQIGDYHNNSEFKRLPTSLQTQWLETCTKVEKINNLISCWTESEQFLKDWEELSFDFKYAIMRLSHKSYLSIRNKLEMSDITAPIYCILNIQNDSELEINPQVNEYVVKSAGIELNEPINLLQKEKLRRSIAKALSLTFPLLNYTPDFRGNDWRAEVFFLCVCKDFLEPSSNALVEKLDLDRETGVPAINHIIESLDKQNLITTHFLDKFRFFPHTEKVLKNFLLAQCEKKLLTTTIGLTKESANFSQKI